MRLPILLAATFVATVTPALAQEPRPYTEGAVTNVAYIRVLPGKFDDYMKYLQGPYKTFMESLKQKGIVVSYGVFNSPGRTPDDWNMVLTTVYPNMAAFDGLEDRTDPIAAKAFGPEEKQNKEAIGRGELRELIGSRLLRELKLR